MTNEQLSPPPATPPGTPAPPTGGVPDLTDELRATSIWTDELVAAARLPVVDVPMVSIGGGIGSFILADVLRISGLPTSSLRVIGNIDTPWQTYEYLTKVSQIPRHERLRSDSTGCPDNVWGFPGYSVREAWNEKTIAPLFNVLTEPIFTDFYTPRAGQAFEAMAKEAERIGFDEMSWRGQVRMIRRRHGGGYFTAYRPADGSAPRVVVRSSFAHVAVGYPGLTFLPDLQRFRDTHGDRVRVVNAYEPHEHVYDTLRKRGGTVVVRGGGIVASRILQRLMEDRMHHGAQTQIVHLLRTFVHGPQKRSRFARRHGGNGLAYQGFNWPKSSWGGQLKDDFDRLEGDERKALYEQLGGTHTPKRKLWQKQMEQARREGWYSVTQGVVDSVEPEGDHRLALRLAAANSAVSELTADFIVDCTGLEGDIRSSALLADLLDHGGAGRNPMGRLDVERSFEVRGTRTEPGRMYASGSATLGGYYAGVDSFLGLQYAALRIADDLAATGFTNRIGIGRSAAQWWRWARNRSVE
ncbi:MAG: hypothetical protein AAF945_01175 [Actinomycetota bacterium]